MVLLREGTSWGYWCTFTCGCVSKFPEMISLNFGAFPQLTLIPKKTDAGLWLVEALAWYKGAFEHGAEHLPLLTKDLPVGGWIDLGEEVSPLHQELLVPEAPLSLPGEVEVLALHLVWGKSRMGAQGALPGEQPQGSDWVHHLTQVMRHSCSPLSALIFS